MPTFAGENEETITIIKYKSKNMEVITFERSAYDELMKDINSFMTQLRAMVNRGSDKRLGDWLDNQDVCLQLSISPRTLQTLRDNGTLAYSQIERKTYYKPEDVKSIIPLVEKRKREIILRKQDKTGNDDSKCKKKGGQL